MIRIASCLVVLVFAAGSVLAAEYTLFDGRTASNLAMQDFVDPRDDEAGKILSVTVADFIDDPADFVPKADDLFEEMLLWRLYESDVNHAMVIQWRAEEDPEDQQYGQETYYDRQDDGTWLRWSHLDQPIDESAFGSMSSDDIQLSDGRSVTILEPTRGFIDFYEEEVMLVRCAVDVDLGNIEELHHFIDLLFEDYLAEAVAGDLVSVASDVSIVIKISNSFSTRRFEHQPFQMFRIG